MLSKGDLEEAFSKAMEIKYLASYTPFPHMELVHEADNVYETTRKEHDRLLSEKEEVNIN